MYTGILSSQAPCSSATTIALKMVSISDALQEFSLNTQHSIMVVVACTVLSPTMKPS